jgi:hypothetical protein
MPDAPSLRQATADEIADALSFALHYDGRKRRHDADQVMGRITADRLVRHLQAAGFMVMKAASGAAPTTAAAMPPPVG